MLTGLTLAAGVTTWTFAPLRFQTDMGAMPMFLFVVNMFVVNMVGIRRVVLQDRPISTTGGWPHDLSSGHC